ncbi:MAG TPA: hypothetical protein VFZ91_11215 [Allosphingosinicella sp.]
MADVITVPTRTAPASAAFIAFTRADLLSAEHEFSARNRDLRQLN